MSFVGQDDVLDAVSEAVQSAAEAVTGDRPPTIERITWRESMDRFGVDKPDMRFGMELVELTDAFAATEFKAFAGAGAIKGTGDLALVVADEWATTCEVLGQLRNDLGRPPVHQGPYHYVWVVEFPLFVGLDAATGFPKPGHHPFCMPHPDDLERLDSDPLSVRALAYDLVLNGWELGSGSIRIHQSDLQRRVFATLGIGEEAANRKFGFFLNPFEYGAPPHGGFGMGLDRLVAILAGEENIREVIAFPKTQSGADPMTSAPSPGDPHQLAELGLRVLPPTS
jgi:aspartyl-tRNA synthetase